MTKTHTHTQAVAVIFRYSRVQSFYSLSLGRLRLVVQRTSRQWMSPPGIEPCDSPRKRESERERGPNDGI